MCPAGARSSGLQPAHSQPRSDDLDAARAPSRPPLSGLKGSNQSQLLQLDWPPALQPSRSDMASNLHHLPSEHDHSHGQHEMHHDLSSPRSQSSHESRSSMASVATAPPDYTAHSAATGPNRYSNLWCQSCLAGALYYCSGVPCCVSSWALLYLQQSMVTNLKLDTFKSVCTVVKDWLAALETACHR